MIIFMDFLVYKKNYMRKKIMGFTEIKHSEKHSHENNNDVDIKIIKPTILNECLANYY